MYVCLTLKTWEAQIWHSNNSQTIRVPNHIIKNGKLCERRTNISKKVKFVEK